MGTNITDDPGYRLWLQYHPVSPARRTAYSKMLSRIAVPGDSPVLDSIITEFSRAAPALFEQPEIVRGECSSEGCSSIISTVDTLNSCCPDWGGEMDTANLPTDEAYQIKRLKSGALCLVSRSETGLLYGTFDLIRRMQMEESMSDPEIRESPALQWRMLNHWDNLDGSIERGYAGQTLWKWAELPNTVDSRYTDYARACASVGLNASVLNNVNTQPEILRDDYLEKVAALASVLRRYGIRTFLSVNFASPILLGGLETADPLDEDVRSWWKERLSRLYKLVPDFGGFLVKADSEGQPGPFAYNRSHADGANMFGELLEPFGGILIWRAFVYGHGEKDRARSAYAHFVPQDGTFLKNVVLQVKNGPIDFQPREPVHPLFGAMDRTSTFLECQIAQEYLGQGNHIVYLGPMWKEILDFDTEKPDSPSRIGDWLSDTGTGRMTGMAAVTNTGDNSEWCGSQMHPANWYAFGRLAWNSRLDPGDIAMEWIRCTFPVPEPGRQKMLELMMMSWEACIDYMTPLGLHHIMRQHDHYGPRPSADDEEREDWCSVYFHRADRNGLGFDRSRNGSAAVDQYFPPVADRLNNPRTCPEKYLLWFHHIPWDFRLESGKTLEDELVSRYRRGVHKVEKMIRLWSELENDVDPFRYSAVKEKLSIQLKDAREWKKVCTEYFLSFSSGS